MQKTALYFAAAFFGVGALGHLVRLAVGFEIAIAGWQVPVWFSVPGTIIAAALAVWMARAAKDDNSGQTGL